MYFIVPTVMKRQTSCTLNANALPFPSQLDWMCGVYVTYSELMWSGQALVHGVNYSPGIELGIVHFSICSIKTNVFLEEVLISCDCLSGQSISLTYMYT